MMAAVYVWLAVLCINLEAWAQSPTDSISSLNAKITSLRFFESGYEDIPRKQQVYKKRFEKSKTRYVNWEMKLEYPAPRRRVDFSIDAVWSRADGSVFTRQTFDAFVDYNLDFVLSQFQLWVEKRW